MQRRIVLGFSCLLIFASLLAASCSNTNSTVTTIGPGTTLDTPIITTLRTTTQGEFIHINSVSIPQETGLINPGGPVVRIKLKSKAIEPIISLTVTLAHNGGLGFGSTVFLFEVSPSNPLMPGESITDTRIVIGGGISGQPYPIEIKGILQSGKTFSFTQYVDVVPEIIVTTGS
jgi:hypothetical protein